MANQRYGIHHMRAKHACITTVVREKKFDKLFTAADDVCRNQNVIFFPLVVFHNRQEGGHRSVVHTSSNHLPRYPRFVFEKHKTFMKIILTRFILAEEGEQDAVQITTFRHSRLR